MRYNTVNSMAAPDLSMWEQATQAHNNAPQAHVEAHFSGPASGIEKLSSMKDLTLSSGQKVPLEFLLQFILYALVEDYGHEIETKSKWLHSERTYQQHKENERAACADTRVKDHQNTALATKARKTTSAISLFISGAIGLTAGSLFAGTAALITGTLLTLDKLFDDAASKQVAKYLSQGALESEALWMDRMQLFTTIASIGLSFGLAGGTAISLAQKGSELSMNGLESYLTYRENTTKATLLEIDLECDETDDNIQRLKDSIEHITKMWHQYVALKFETEQKRSDLIRQACHSMRN